MRWVGERAVRASRVDIRRQNVYIMVLPDGERILDDRENMESTEKTKKPFIKYIRDCQACFLCEIDCPVEAIYVSPDRERRVPLPW